VDARESIMYKSLTRFYWKLPARGPGWMKLVLPLPFSFAWCVRYDDARWPNNYAPLLNPHLTIHPSSHPSIGPLRHPSILSRNWEWNPSADILSDTFISLFLDSPRRVEHFCLSVRCSLRFFHVTDTLQMEFGTFNFSKKSITLI